MKRLGRTFRITRDARGYALLDSRGLKIASGPELEAMESAAALLGGVTRPGSSWELRGQENVPGDPATWRPA